MAVNVAIYARVSTERQTTDPQKDELRAEAQRRGWTVMAEIEDVISGAKFTRTGLDNLMALVRRHAIKAVLCYKLDRLGRSLPHLAQMIAEFDAHGVALVCTNQGIDTSNTNPAGRLVMHVLMAIAEFERSLTIDRTKIGMRAARARGKHIGRKPAPMPANASVILAEWKDSGGMNYRALAAQLGVNVGTAYRYARLNRRPAPTAGSLKSDDGKHGALR